QCDQCNFNPKEETMYEKPSLSDLEDELHEILDTWTDFILTNFNDPTVKESMKLVEPQQKALLDELISNKAFTLPISIELIHTINNVMKGIHNEQINTDDLIKVFGNGHPITLREVKDNMEQLLHQLVGTKDRKSVV